VGLRPRPNLPTLGGWSLGELPQRAQQAVEGGLPGGVLGVTNFPGGLLHSSCWCVRHAFRHCACCTELSLMRACAALPSRTAIVGDFRLHPDWPAASMDVRAFGGARELSARARFARSHAERPCALPTRPMQCAQMDCNLSHSLWVRQGMSEHCWLDGVRSVCR
jgi:hypothetical protein